MTTPLRLVGFAGSLRAASFNRALLRACVELAPSDVTIDVHDLRGIPVFDEDLEAQGDPEPVARLKAAVGAAHGIIIAVPEYNHGVPGGLKNAIDWLSRPPRGSVLNGRPVALVGATLGTTGTARAQTQLRASFVFTNSPCMPQPEVLVSQASTKFDAEGRLADERTRAYIRDVWFPALATWVRRFA